MGYWYRPSYKNYTDDSVLSTVLDRAIKDSDNSDITFQQCFLHNSLSDLTGRNVPACLLDYAGHKYPSQMVVGGISYNLYTVDFAGQANLSAIQYMRTQLTNYNAANVNLQSKLQALLNREVSLSERQDISLAWEEAMLNYYLPLYRKEASTAFGSGQNYSSQSLVMYAERSTDDSLAEVSKVNTGLLIGAAVLIAVYTAATMINIRSSIFTHVGLILWGLTTVVIGTGRALGISTYWGVDFTVLTTNVIPFVALALGLHHIFIVSHAYAREVSMATSTTKVLTKVMGETGPSIAFTMFVTLTAVLIAASTREIIVQLFCWQLATCIVCNYLTLITLFIPAMVLDCDRTLAGKADFGIMACSNDANNEPGFIEAFCMTNYPAELLNTHVRIVVSMVFLAWFAVSIWSGQLWRSIKLCRCYLILVFFSCVLRHRLR